MWAGERLQEGFTGSTGTNGTGAQGWTEVYEAVGWIQLLMALLSVLGSASTIVRVMLQRLGRTPELQPLLLLSGSDLLLAACRLLGAAMFSQRCRRLSALCYHLHSLEQILCMASFFFTLHYVWDLYTGTRLKYHSCTGGFPVTISSRVRSANRVTALLSGLFPVLLMTPVLIQGNISQCQANFSQPYGCLLMHAGAPYVMSEQQHPIRACRLLNTYSIAIFLAAFLLTLLSITVLVVKARRMYRRVVTSGGYLGYQQQAAFRLTDRRTLLYPLVFLLCWAPAGGLAFLWMVRPSACRGEAGVALYVSQAFTSTSQGFLNCLVYGWTQAALRRASRVTSCRDADTQTPLLRSQKKRSYQERS